METLHSTTSVEIVVLRMIDKLPKINQLRHTVQLVSKEIQRHTPTALAYNIITVFM